MHVTVFYADYLHKEDNCLYPNKVVVASVADMTKVQNYDHVCAEYKNNYRNIGNYVISDNVMMDCDNANSDDPDDWITPVDIDNMLPDVAYILVFSRNHMKQKDGKAARPKFHVYFPIHPLDDSVAYAGLKAKIYNEFPFFDAGAIDAARFVYGSPGAEILWHEGELNIDDYLALSAKSSITKSSIPKGTRNTTLHRYSVIILKRFGLTEDTYQKYLKKSKECEPPLSQKELDNIWKSACKFYKVISSSPDYIPPDKYNGGSLKPDDFSHIGEARTFTAAYNNEVCYTEATGFLRYNGINWEESYQRSKKAVMEHTDLQLKEANIMINAAFEKMETLGTTRAETMMLRKNQLAIMSIDKTAAYQELISAKDYHAFVMRCRNINGVKSILEASMPLMEKQPDELDNNPFLLNTPTFTYNLKKGLNGMQEHNYNDYITKVTMVSPDTKGDNLWNDALDVFFCGDKELINYVQRIVGLAAIGNVYLEAMIIAYGSGRNGKSTFWNTIARVLGNYAGNMSADTLTVGCKRNVKPEMAELKGKRLVIASELEEGMHLNSSMIKQLCSTDAIYAEKKYKAPFSFTPSHTLVLYTNHLPKVSAYDLGTWRRLIVIPFNATIDGSSDIKNYTEYLAKHAGGAILSWIIEGSRKAIAENYNIKPPNVVCEAIAAYREKNDWLSVFLNEKCAIDPSYKQKSGELYDAYLDYCVNTKEHKHSTKDFYAALEQAGYHKMRNNKGSFVYGLMIKSDYHTNEMDFGA
ncbi:phage/plasmid primase, P4 family [Ruminococcus flavefaciens]|uniref:phage/plasmid primase, P4 family n=1 Tax=Ruminococcus flavefaciens TaxID=1265 RepID=UPI000465BBC6|nr:phage/plasmid primase, P4 family [Ruminococcus flavefaciens]